MFQRTLTVFVITNPIHTVTMQCPYRRGRELRGRVPPDHRSRRLEQTTFGSRTTTTPTTPGNSTSRRPTPEDTPHQARQGRDRSHRHVEFRFGHTGHRRIKSRAILVVDILGCMHIAITVVLATTAATVSVSLITVIAVVVVVVVLPNLLIVTASAGRIAQTLVGFANLNKLPFRFLLTIVGVLVGMKF